MDISRPEWASESEWIDWCNRTPIGVLKRGAELEAELARICGAESAAVAVNIALNVDNQGLREENQRLREAIDTELICCHIGTLDSMKSPKHAIAAIARWHYDLGESQVLRKGE